VSPGLSEPAQQLVQSFTKKVSESRVLSSGEKHLNRKHSKVISPELNLRLEFIARGVPHFFFAEPDKDDRGFFGKRPRFFSFPQEKQARTYLKKDREHGVKK